jgi:preprotein translocase subunit YajC
VSLATLPVGPPTCLEEAHFVRQLASLLPIILIFAVMWLLMIRPAQRRQAQAMTLQKSVEVGDDVVLTSGIFGTVVEITDDHLGVEVAEGVAIRVLRGAIASKVHRDDEGADDEAVETGETPAADTADTADDAGAAVSRED